MASFDLAKAIKNNTIYANTTKPPWRDRFYQVAEQLGLRHQTPTAAALAEAIYNWQLKQPGMTADGMLGPNGWKILEPKTRYSIDLGEPPAWITEMPPGWTPTTAQDKGPEKNGITDFIDQRIAENPKYETTLVNTGVFVGSLTLGKLNALGKLGKFLAGAVIQPLVWAYQGNTGDDWDKILYGLGLIPPLTVAAGIVGVWKGRMDDDILKKLAEIQAAEPRHLEKLIFPTATYSWSPPAINAQRIASRGGVAWQHPNGLWVYLKMQRHSKDVLVCDYKPKVAAKILGPELPLRPIADQFVWRSHKGGF
jgi:hypothetical protein